jgi:hypothetical protein
MHRESADTYRGEIARLGGWRVAECADRLQWLLQRKVGERWRSESFCRTRSALIRLWQRATGDDGAALGDLPLHFAPKLRAGARQEPQVGFPASHGRGRVEPPHSTVFRGGSGMTALRIARLRRCGLTAEQAALVADLVWGAE